jgi:excisionase family DNA binding protein
MSAERDETFLTVAEVAEWLKLNQQTVRNWIDQGALPAVRVGRRVRIKRSDLDQILDAGYRPSAGPGPSRPIGPSADDFWSGEPVGMAEPDPSAGRPSERPELSDPSQPKAQASEPSTRNDHEQP